MAWVEHRMTVCLVSKRMVKASPITIVVIRFLVSVGYRDTRTTTICLRPFLEGFPRFLDRDLEHISEENVSSWARQVRSTAAEYPFSRIVA